MSKAKSQNDDLLSLAQAMEVLGVSRQTMYRLLESKVLPGSRVGRQWRFRRDDLQRYLQRDSMATALADAPDEQVTHVLAAIEAGLGEWEDELPAEDETIADFSERRVSQLVQGLMMLAYSARASDLHLEPLREAGQTLLCVRLRVDGVLHQALTLPYPTANAILQRIKVLSGINVEDRGQPQDGRCQVRLKDEDIVIRVSILPGLWGEAAVLRLLPTGFQIPRLEELLPSEDLVRLQKWVHRPSGLIIGTGPQGSGRTTVMYSVLREITRPELKVVAVEDPVEFAIPGILQVAVNRRLDVTFNTVLRAFLRHDPDVIYVGELRDLDICTTTLRAAQTGHLVLTTMYAPDAITAALRLRDSGVESFLLNDTLTGIWAQRLVRRSCPHCRQPAAPAITSRLLALAAEGGWTAPSDTRMFNSSGCSQCHGRGYTGRLAVFELLEFTPALREGLVRGLGREELRRLALAEGFVTLTAAAVRLAAEEQTSVDEILHLTG